jgi:hypothetical protein
MLNVCAVVSETVLFEIIVVVAAKAVLPTASARTPKPIRFKVLFFTKILQFISDAQAIIVQGDVTFVYRTLFSPFGSPANAPGP